MTLIWKVLRVGGWAPLLVFAIHVLLDRVGAYDAWPPADVPMHFCGGLAIAFFASRCFRALPRQDVPRNRLALLELLLAVSLTATAAVFWEFSEFALDRLTGSNVQVSLANTMKDMAMGILGSVGFIAFRAARLRAGANAVRELTLDWLRGREIQGDETKARGNV